MNQGDYVDDLSEEDEAILDRVWDEVRGDSES